MAKSIATRLGILAVVSKAMQERKNQYGFDLVSKACDIAHTNRRLHEAHRLRQNQHRLRIDLRCIGTTALRCDPARAGTLLGAYRAYLLRLSFHGAAICTVIF